MTADPAPRPIAFVPLAGAFVDQAVAVFNHWVTTSTVIFYEEPFDADELRRVFLHDDPRLGAWAILHDRAFAGFLALRLYNPRPAYRYTGEVSLFLDPARRGQGLGTAALDFVEARAVEGGFHALIAAICAENEASLALFSKKGYDRCGHFREVGYKFERWLDVVYCQRVLPLAKTP